MPMTFPAHQGLILPAVRRWPNSLDALAVSVGAAMPDITDSILGFPINGYFKQWYGHALIGIFTLDLAGGLFLTWLMAGVGKRLFRDREVPTYLRPLITVASRNNDFIAGQSRSALSLWSFSVLVGILSHIGFDLISHDTNLLLYPWTKDPHWFPSWWYTKWFEIRPLHAFGRSYSVGVFSVIWVLLTLVGTFSFIQFFVPKHKNRKR
jgi:hypothetical protein